MTNTCLLAALTLAGTFAIAAVAAPLTFDFRDPKGVNAIQFSIFLQLFKSCEFGLVEREHK